MGLAAGSSIEFGENLLQRAKRPAFFCNALIAKEL
jgi:hypothetical protein